MSDICSNLGIDLQSAEWAKCSSKAFRSSVAKMQASKESEVLWSKINRLSSLCHYSSFPSIDSSPSALKAPLKQYLRGSLGLGSQLLFQCRANCTSFHLMSELGRRPRSRDLICPYCQLESEDLQHVLLKCPAYNDGRERLANLQKSITDKEKLSQMIGARTPDVYMKVILSEEYMGQFLSSEVLDVWLDGVKSFLCCIHSIRSESSLLASEALPLNFEVLDELDSSDAACCESPSRSVRSDSQEVTLRSREAYGHMAMASTSRLNE